MCKLDQVKCEALSYLDDRFLTNVYNKHIKNSSRAQQILNFDTKNVDTNTKKILKTGIRERALPSNELFRGDDWQRTMFLRYGLAVHYSKAKNVLDTCSGLGWGAFLLDGVASSVTCIELDGESLNLSRRLWHTNRTAFVKASVLKIPIQDNQCDVAVSMECIEHFSLSDIKKYFSEMCRVLKPGGILVGSSFFPDTTEDAVEALSADGFHLHVCTKERGSFFGLLVSRKSEFFRTGYSLRQENQARRERKKHSITKMHSQYHSKWNKH
jgi:ubiquinone/menaquinone biosynthesis C-methylase UbiE